MKEHIKIFEKFNEFAFQGEIKLNNPDRIYTIIEDYISLNLNGDIKQVKNIYFGIQVAKGKNEKGTYKYYDELCLSNRIYLGPASNDTELAFMMVMQIN